jgi:heptosyltransferase-2
MKILIVQTSFLGDTILSTPVIGGVKQIYPDAELWIMTTPLSSQLVMRDPMIAGVIPFDKRGAERGLGGILAMAKKIRSMEFDLVYALHRSYRTSVLMWLSKIPMRIGFREAGFSFLYNQTCFRAPNNHDVIRNLSILNGWGEPTDFPGEMRLFPPPASQLGDEVRALLPDDPYVVLFPGSVGKTKRWHPEGFRETALYLKAQGYGVVLLGAAEDVPANRMVADGIDVVDLGGKTSISDAIYIVSRSKLMVCNDSMSLHMASALKIPTVVIFCATTPALGFGPWRNNARVVEKGLSCRPCRQHSRKYCPDGTLACIREVSADEVIKAINAVLEEAGSES